VRAKDHPLGQYATGCPPFDKQIYGLLWKEIKAQWAVQTIGADSTKR